MAEESSKLDINFTSKVGEETRNRDVNRAINRAAGRGDRPLGSYFSKRDEDQVVRRVFDEAERRQKLLDQTSRIRSRQSSAALGRSRSMLRSSTANFAGQAAEQFSISAFGSSTTVAAGVGRIGTRTLDGLMSGGPTLAAIAALTALVAELQHVVEASRNEVRAQHEAIAELRRAIPREAENLERGFKDTRTELNEEIERDRRIRSLKQEVRRVRTDRLFDVRLPQN